MLPLCQLFVQTPENLDNLEGRDCDGIGEIATWRRHSSDNGHGSKSVFVTQTLDFSSSLVKLSQFRLHVSWIALIGGHFSQTTRNLPQGFGPPRGGIGHHRDIVTLVPEVLSQRDSSVNGSLPSGDGHI